MKKELVEEALTNIDDRYIEEALTYKKSKIINFPRTTSKLVKAATVTLAVLAVGSATVYAGAEVLKKIFYTEHTLSTGNPDYVRDEWFETETPEPEVEQIGGEISDGTEKWITKSTEILGSYTNDIYIYSTYEDAVADTGMKLWFDTLPGEVTDVTYTYAYCDNDYAKFIDVVAEYNGSEYYLTEEIWGGNVADDVGYSLQFENKQNERVYTNANGIVFNIADDVVQDEQFDENGESVYVTRVRSTTMILDGDYYGNMVFDDMSEDDIHYILDQIKIGK